MPELDLAFLPSSPQPPPCASASPASRKTLHPLSEPKDGKFLASPDHLAGRAVCIALYAKGDSRESRERAWQKQFHDGTDLAVLGRAAKALENGGYDWRKLTTVKGVLAAAEHLFKVATH
jgi:hypothetical protein